MRFAHNLPHRESPLPAFQGGGWEGVPLNLKIKQPAANANQSAPAPSLPNTHSLSKNAHNP